MNSFSLTSRITVTLGFMALLALVSLLPGIHRPGDHIFIWLVAETPTLIQKILHILLYAMLAILLMWTLEGMESRTSRLLAALVTAVAFGALMEWGQTRVPGRFGSLYDVVLNAGGAALGLLASIFLL
jgi:hypothetical protein